MLAQRTSDPKVRAAHLKAALPALERAVKHGFHVHEANTYLATVHQLDGRPKEALAASAAAIKARPHDPAVLLAALRLHAALGSCDEARRLREDLRTIRGEDAEADQLVAQCRPAGS